MNTYYRIVYTGHPLPFAIECKSGDAGTWGLHDEYPTFEQAMSDMVALTGRPYVLVSAP
jgi:hypothetical protein